VWHSAYLDAAAAEEITKEIESKRRHIVRQQQQQQAIQQPFKTTEEEELARLYQAYENLTGEDYEEVGQEQSETTKK
jgi:hypothetical protein